jgi:uncharacterized damage-inducible protein DinB
MNHISPILATQYDYVKVSRNVLLEYCSSISNSDLKKENSSFGRGSIRNLLVHIANTYEFWIGKYCLERDVEFAEYASIQNVEELHMLFDKIDALVGDFLSFTKDHDLLEIEYEISGKKGKASYVKLFTHVITHEFHHKGQILSLSRHLGYVPVDTDIMR